MPPLLSHRTSLALQGSLALGLAFGLLAVGPIVIDHDPRYADARPWWGVPNAMLVLCSLPLAVASGIGLWFVRRVAGWPAALRQPVAMFLGVSCLVGLLSALHHLQPHRVAMVALHVLVASSCMLLLLAFLAERVDLRFGSPRACAAAVTASALAASWWWVSGGDVRILVWLEAQPALLVATGILGQPGLFTRTRDWAAMLALYVGARLADVSDILVQDLLGDLSGHALMHLGGAGAAAVLSHRVWRVAGQRPAPGDQACGDGSAKRRQTSLHTAG